MKILFVVHSFVPYTMAGTEVYSYNLAKALARQHRVYVFFRINNTQEREYSLKHQTLDSLDTYAINHTFRSCNSFSSTYKDESIDRKFAELLDNIKPDIVHIHHLLFLSYGMVDEIKKRGIPIVYTLHDYWLICYRGQLIKDDLTLCKGDSLVQCQDCLKYLLSIRKHSMYLYAILKKRIPAFFLELLKMIHLVMASPQPSNELKRRKEAQEALYAKIDLFTAPSNFIKNKFIEQGFPKDKILYSPYGFDSGNFIRTPKSKSRVLRFAYMGTLIPFKGVDLLISAFKQIKNINVRLSIYGKVFVYSGFESYPGLLKKAVKSDKRIELKGAYDNKDVGKIFADIDVLIVPSLWLENAPLVIQEAFLSKTPVVASKVGGIPELVNDGVNGLLFNPQDTQELQEKIEYIIENPAILEKFKENIPEVKGIEDDAGGMEQIYSGLIAKGRP